MTAQSSPARVNYATFDGLRGVAALVVVLFHLAYRAETPQIFTRGYLAVDLFFGLSGFVIAQAYGGRLMAGMGVVRFTALRLARLYPLFFLGQVLGLIVLAIHGHQVLALIKAFAAGSAMVPWPVYLGNVPPIFPLNGPSWSLFFEVAVNIAFALTIAVLSRRALWLILIVSCAALVGAAAHFGSLHLGWNVQNFVGGIPRVVFSFAAGVLLFRLAPKVATGNLVPLLLILGSVAVLFIGPAAWWIDVAVVVVAFPAMLFAAASWQPTGIVKGISHQLGRMSYPLYIIHTPALYAAALMINGSSLPDVQKPFAWAVAMLGILGVAAILPAIYDDPIRRVLERKLSLKGGRPISAERRGPAF